MSANIVGVRASLVGGLLLLTTLGPVHAADPTIRVSRYTTLADGLDTSQVDPLAAVISVRFPRPQVKTVGDALAYILPRTGFRLGEQLGESVLSTLAQPLPESQRSLGPCTAQKAIEVLFGTAFDVRINRGSRTLQVIALQAGVGE